MSPIEKGIKRFKKLPCLSVLYISHYRSQQLVKSFIPIVERKYPPLWNFLLNLTLQQPSKDAYHMTYSLSQDCHPLASANMYI
jgi:hypothetical protein